MIPAVDPALVIPLSRGNIAAMPRLLRLSCLCVLLLLAPDAFAWGPHSEITQASLDALGTNDALIKHLGPYAKKLTHYCWMADYRRTPFDRDGEWFYADDYLLFPGMERHLDHLVPEVKLTYAPYFKRAVQALRTEDAANAARWIGSLLHFVEDTGSPPHSAEIRGDVHSKMENWVDAKQIKLGDYQTQLLGKTEDEALAGFLKRMDGLIAFSKERGERCRPLVLADKRAEVEPIVLESALETSRVVADLLHTLGLIGPRISPPEMDIEGRCRMPRPLGLERLPVKIVIEGTQFSTLSQTNGDFIFRGMPYGKYRYIGFCAGFHNRVTNEVVLQPDRTQGASFATGTSLHSSTDLLRNGEFSISWVNGKTPDCWYRTKEGWEGELLPLKKSASYRLALDWQDKPQGDVVLRFRPNTHPGLPVVDSPPIKPGTTEHKFNGSEKFVWAQVILRTTNAPASLLKHVAVVPEP